MNAIPLNSQDLRKLIELQPEGWPDITPYFEFYINSSFCHPIKVLYGNRIAGIGTTILHQNSAWLAHIIVHPEFRNRGIGGFVTKSLIDSVEQESFPTLSLIATPLGEPVYKKLGFQRVTEYLFFKHVEYQAATEDNSSIIEAAPALFDEILSFDKSASGEDRATLLKPHLQKVNVFRENNKISGFYAPTLGEGLIMAENDTAGLALLKLKIRTSPFSVVPSDNESAIHFLLHSGFQQFLKGSRMSLGKKLEFKPNMLFNRIGGNLG